jgi:hypothetical protein
MSKQGAIDEKFLKRMEQLRVRFEEEPTDPLRFYDYIIRLFVVSKATGKRDDMLRVFARAPKIQTTLIPRQVSDFYISNKLDHLLPEHPGFRREILNMEGWRAIRSGEDELAERKFSESLELSLVNLEAVSGLATAYWRQGRIDEYEKINSLNDYIYMVDLKQHFPADEMHQINEDIIRSCEQTEYRSGRVEYGDSAGVDYISAFRDEDQKPIDLLQGIMFKAFSQILHRLPDDPSNPFLARKAGHFKSLAKGLVMGPDSQLKMHMHHGADPLNEKLVPWYLAVYYPRGYGEPDDPTRSGWLQLGALTMDPDDGRKPPVRHIRPETGLLVFFPAHYRHGVTHRGDGMTRYSVNYDLVPSTASGK